MKFDDLDKKMRVYETAHDVCVLPGMYMVARIDGRSFTRLTKEVHKFKAPFDETFRDYMIKTTEHLMNCGFKVIYGFTESDEISLLFDLEANVFGRKHRKYNSILAGEASAKVSTLLGAVAAFDCRISELPTKDLVVDYFRWRNEDAHRNALNAHCYWKLRYDGFSGVEATKKMDKLNVAAKNELLFGYGVNFNDLPNWQKRGIGLYWKDYEKNALNPKTQQEITVVKKEINIDLDLPMRDEYNTFIFDLMTENENTYLNK
jgi:tRNA(His) 5'-end guanylyltransferase